MKNTLEPITMLNNITDNYGTFSIYEKPEKTSPVLTLTKYIYLYIIFWLLEYPEKATSHNYEQCGQHNITS